MRGLALIVDENLSNTSNSIKIVSFMTKNTLFREIKNNFVIFLHIKCQETVIFKGYDRTIERRRIFEYEINN